MCWYSRKLWSSSALVWDWGRTGTTVFKSGHVEPPVGGAIGGIKCVMWCVTLCASPPPSSPELLCETGSIWCYSVVAWKKKTVERLKPKQTSWSRRKLLRLDLHSRSCHASLVTSSSFQIFCPHSALLNELVELVWFRSSPSGWLVNHCVVCYWCRRFCQQVTPQVSSRCGFNNDIREWQNPSWLVHCGW